MYQKVIPFDSDSFMEISSRITGSGEQLMLSIRGRKNSTETTVASVLLNEDQAKLLAEYIRGWTPEKLSENVPE